MADRSCCYREQMAFSLYSFLKEPRLFRMVNKGEYHKIPTRCRSHPQEATFRHKYVPYDTPLHLLLRYSPNDDILEAVKALIQASPGTTKQKDAFGRTPLHLACMDVQEEVMTHVLQANPAAVTMVDVEKRTPLHYLLARNEVCTVHSVRLLVKCGPETVSFCDSAGDTPEDILRQGDFENMKELMEVLRAP